MRLYEELIQSRENVKAASAALDAATNDAELNAATTALIEATSREYKLQQETDQARWR